ncbi:hypothetical protein LTR49_023287 [Elasticomyces elasticus]|nr:hypothetical protein LTR49_023287 [Elasticomyces elasticus]KAK5750555.1 hypothetical protein LTS12_019345 [Elasticomyces elasticus]
MAQDGGHDDAKDFVSDYDPTFFSHMEVLVMRDAHSRLKDADSPSTARAPHNNAITLSSAKNDPMYQPLTGHQPVRLLRLLPGKAGEPLITQLVCEHLENAKGCYDATSYTWGRPDNLRDIVCNDKPFAMRENAYSFLERLRSTTESRMLWMDCICINQGDLGERAAQVLFMHEIYQYAQTVVVWLGPEADDSAVAMEYILTLDAKTYVAEAVEDFFSLASETTKTFVFDQWTLDNHDPRLVKALLVLLERPWLRRVWVQQEAAVCENTRVMCGAYDVTWDQLFSLAWIVTRRTTTGWPEWVAYPSIALESGMKGAANIQRSRIHHLRMFSQAYKQNTYYSVSRPSGVGETFDGLIAKRWWCEATDPRDKIFALYNLGVWNADKLAGRPKVSYKDAWQMIYTKTALWMLQVGWTTTLSYAGHRDNVPAELPSWVPDWRNAREHLFRATLEWSAGGAAKKPVIRTVDLAQRKRAVPGLYPCTYTDGPKRIKQMWNAGLELSAILVDKIIYRSSAALSGQDSVNLNHMKMRRTIEADLAFIKHHVPKYMTGEPSEEAYAGALITNMTHEEKLASKAYEKEGFAAFRAWLEPASTGPCPDYLDAVESAEALDRNAFYVTAHGLMGLVPGVATVGDYVAILDGFREPVGIRRAAGCPDPYYELLGPCYIQRMMRSRAWNLILEHKCKYQGGSEDRAPAPPREEENRLRGVCEGFPFNLKTDYESVLEVLGKRKIVLL